MLLKVYFLEKENHLILAIGIFLITLNLIFRISRTEKTLQNVRAQLPFDHVKHGWYNSGPQARCGPRPLGL